ncbi:hypothetical protein ABFA07_004290 [Porites harrisoni]
MSARVAFLALISTTFATSIWASVAGIKYFIATSGKQNCDSVCASFGLQCAGTGQSFPNSSALSIFESLGITCDTNNYTDYYFYKDQPNYISASPPSKDLQWAGRCTGFKAIPSTIDCYTANNDNVRRLCPCKNPSGTKSPTQSTPALNTHGHEIKSSTSGGKVSSAQTRASQKQSTGNNAPQRKTENEEEESNSVKRIALFAVTAILAGGLLLCILVLLFLFIWRRHLSTMKRDKGPHNEKYRVEYHINNNSTDVLNMMDGLSMEPEREEEGDSYCERRTADLSVRNPNVDKEARNSVVEESSYEKSTDNVLYVSGSGEAHIALSKEQTPSDYERLV